MQVTLGAWPVSLVRPLSSSDTEALVLLFLFCFIHLFIFIYFIFGCVGSSLLHAGLL